MKALVRLRCRDCGYGVSVREPPEACPMCRGADWEEEGWRPFSALAGDLLHPHRAPSRPRRAARKR